MLERRLDRLESGAMRAERASADAAKAAEEALTASASTLGLACWVLPSLCAAHSPAPKLVSYLSRTSPARIMRAARSLGRGLVSRSWSLRSALADMPDEAGLDTKAFSGKTRAEWRESCRPEPEGSFGGSGKGGVRGKLG